MQLYTENEQFEPVDVRSQSGGCLFSVRWTCGFCLVVCVFRPVDVVFSPSPFVLFSVQWICVHVFICNLVHSGVCPVDVRLPSGACAFPSGVGGGSGGATTSDAPPGGGVAAGQATPNLFRTFLESP